MILTEKFTFSLVLRTFSQGFFKVTNLKLTRTIGHFMDNVWSWGIRKFLSFMMFSHGWLVTMSLALVRNQQSNMWGTLTNVEENSSIFENIYTGPRSYSVKEKLFTKLILRKKMFRYGVKKSNLSCLWFVHFRKW